jgi:hypothetical protein
MRTVLYRIHLLIDNMKTSVGVLYIKMRLWGRKQDSGKTEGERVCVRQCIAEKRDGVGQKMRG